MITRRSLLQAGVGTAVVVAVGGVPGVALADQPNWEALRRRLTGQLFLPADAGYPVAKEVQYAQYGSINPAAVAFCQTVADVQACVTFARMSRESVGCSSSQSPSFSLVTFSTSERISVLPSFVLV